ncbi:uncharacterized protein LOC119684167 [Teleopsis dalmanni]|uniref:uncharacterized protein LOC119684167 n=1 Tax=Teleopsis dalmanni TaxID=139649 RepID=UPI0018CD0D0F|nr:uncharacterized protein LOC119684167 [Teleopsis dalmanni]
MNRQNYCVRNDMRILVLIVVPQHRAITKQEIIECISAIFGIPKDHVINQINKALRWALQTKKIKIHDKKFIKTVSLDFWSSTENQTESKIICCPHCHHRIVLNQLYWSSLMKIRSPRFNIRWFCKNICKYCRRKRSVS